MDRSIDINKIFQRRPAREFLSIYPTKLWNEIIPDVFEIGILNLKNSFNTLKFSRNDFDSILYELRNYKPKKKQYYQNEEEENEEEEYEEDSYYDQSYHSNKSINKTGKNFTIARTEVFIPDIKEIERNITKFHPRRPYYTSIGDIKIKNRENNRNLSYVESKIRPQVLNDRMNYKAFKTQNDVNRNYQRGQRKRNNMNYNNNNNINNNNNNFDTFHNNENFYDSNSNNNMNSNNNYDNNNYNNMNNNMNNQDYLQRSGNSNFYNNNDMANYEMTNSNYNNQQENYMDNNEYQS